MFKKLSHLLQLKFCLSAQLFFIWLSISCLLVLLQYCLRFCNDNQKCIANGIPYKLKCHSEGHWILTQYLESPKGIKGLLLAKWVYNLFSVCFIFIFHWALLTHVFTPVKSSCVFSFSWIFMKTVITLCWKPHHSATVVEVQVFKLITARFFSLSSTKW